MTNTPYQLIILDCDGTAVDFKTGEYLANVEATLDAVPGTTRLAFATNQGGPACRDMGWTIRDGGEYPTVEIIRQKYGKIASRFSARLYVSFGYKMNMTGNVVVPAGYGFTPEVEVSRRKPAAGMLREAARDAKVMPQFCLMVGDSADDEGAARNFGCKFMWAKDFFGWS